MGLRDIVAGGIATAKSIVGGPGNLMDTVTIRYWIRDLDEHGTMEHSSAVSFEAIVERKQKMVKKSDGQEALSTSYIALLETPPARGTGMGRREPLDERDIITLSDGTTAPILTMTGLMDPTLSAPFLFEVYLG